MEFVAVKLQSTSCRPLSADLGKSREKEPRMEQAKQPSKSVRANQNCGPSLFVDEPIDAGLSENADEEEGIQLNAPGMPDTPGEDESERTTLNTSGVQEGWAGPHESARGPKRRSA